MKSYSAHSTIHRRATRRAGFTLVEIMVVLAIVAIVSAITVGGYSELRAGNKRTSCQTNLVQIYQAARLYSADNGAFPPYSSTSTAHTGIGLWALYGYPNAVGSDVDTAKPINRYLRNTNVLHCPNDFSNTNLNSSGGVNLGYLSYQTWDATAGVAPYAGDRGLAAADPNWRRQLLIQNASSHNIINPDADTVVTGRQWHRTGSGGRDYDNVLFYNGEVEFLPRQEDTTTGSSCATLGGTCVTGWQRLPKPPPS